MRLGWLAGPRQPLGTNFFLNGCRVQPSLRAAMAYDAATGTAVLFGGYDITLRGRVHDFSDTWSWG